MTKSYHNPHLPKRPSELSVLINVTYGALFTSCFSDNSHYIPQCINMAVSSLLCDVVQTYIQSDLA